ncbi:unnamed protein product [Mycena citricolor]|uniref:Secreted protein n=1 Tax=Mycena citricolor TaxID=2018698 RepID=A0AAD2HT57_9AGAR|nr:unnamed protein product [Mycena citricolor]
MLSRIAVLLFLVVGRAYSAPVDASVDASPLATYSGDGEWFLYRFTQPLIRCDRRTFYVPGLGACGRVNRRGDLMWHGASKVTNPNLNPICGKRLKATYRGKFSHRDRGGPLRRLCGCGRSRFHGGWIQEARGAGGGPDRERAVDLGLSTPLVRILHVGSPDFMNECSADVDQEPEAGAIKAAKADVTGATPRLVRQ